MKKGVLILILLITSRVCSAQSIEFSAQANRSSVPVGQPFQLTYTINVNGNFTLPDLKNFQIISGPNLSFSQESVLQNNKYQQRTLYIAQLVVRPLKEGEFTIPPASVFHNGKTYKSNSVKITVTPSNSAQQEQTQTKVESDKNVFCAISVSKASPYQGEPVIVTYKLYTLYRITDYEFEWNSQKGVWLQEITQPTQGWDPYEEIINRKRYTVYPIKKELIIPQSPGKLKLQPFGADIVVLANFRAIRFDLQSNAPEIDVQSLPGGKPEGFSNAVGKFQLESKISKENVKVNDGIDFTIKISGSGNIKLVEAPGLQFPPDFETYDPETNEKINSSSNGMSGYKEYKYLVIPRHAGDYKIPSLKFAYFDIESKRYIPLTTPEYNIHVDKGSGESASNTTPGQKNIQMLDKDIRYLKAYTDDFIQKNSFFTHTLPFYTGVAGGPLLLLLIFLVRRITQKTTEEIDLDKQKHANKTAIKQLTIAKTCLDKGDKDHFYIETIKALNIYLGDKLKMQPSEINRDNIRNKLIENGVSAEHVNEFIAIMDKCEMARYAAFMQGNEQEIYKRSLALITTIDQNLKTV